MAVAAGTAPRDRSRPGNWLARSRTCRADRRSSARGTACTSRIAPAAWATGRARVQSERHSTLTSPSSGSHCSTRDASGSSRNIAATFARRSTASLKLFRKRPRAILLNLLDERRLVGLKVDTGLSENQPGDALGLRGVVLLLCRRVPRLRESCAVKRAEQKEVDIRGLDCAEACLAARYGLSSEVLESERFVTECPNEGWQGVSLGLQSLPDGRDEDLHASPPRTRTASNPLRSSGVLRRQAPALVPGWQVPAPKASKGIADSISDSAQGLLALLLGLRPMVHLNSDQGITLEAWGR